MEELQKKFKDALDKSKEKVKTFINEIFGKGNLDGYKDKELYRCFYEFNFDWFNFAHKDFNFNKKDGEYGECIKKNKWYKDYKELPKLDNIKKSFRDLNEKIGENVDDVDGKLIAISKDSNEFRGGGNNDPDSMNIVRDILFVIYSDVIETAWDKMEQSTDIIDLFKGDTMNSFHYSFGKLKYNGRIVEDSREEYIFMYDYIDGFSNMEGVDEESIKKIKEFFNQYHTLGNFVLSPAITVKRQSINKYRRRYENDNYYAYIDELFKARAENKNEMLTLLIDANKGFFSQFKEKKDYYEAMDIPGEYGKIYYFLGKEAMDIPCEYRKIYYFLRKEAKDKKDYDSIKNYIDTTEEIIKYRCSLMIDKLFEKLNEE